MENRLVVSVGAELGDLTNKLRQAGKDVSNFAVNAEGNIIGFEKSIVTLERQLKSFQNGLKNTLDPSRIATLNSAIKITQDRLSATNQVINGVGLNKLTVGANQAGFALTNLGRVAQDAPFGFIGIQNNINPLLESFQRLRQETGSNVGALKALGSSLTGAGGIGLAVSIITSLATFAAVGFDRWTGSTKKLKEETKDYKDTLTGLNKTVFDANAQSGEEISRLNLLFRTTQNVSLSLKDRQLAVKELQKQYPNYFANLTTENALTNTATENYNKLKKEIIATALARAADKDTAKQGEVIFENLAKRSQIQAQINKLQAENNALSAKNTETTTGGTVFGQAIAFNAQKIKELKVETDQYDKAIKNANTSIFNNSQLQDAIIRKFGVQAVVTKDAAKALKDLARIKIDPVKIGLEERGEEVTKATKPLIEKIIKGLQGTKPSVVPIPIDPILVSAAPLSAEDFEKQLSLDRLKESLISFAETTSTQIAPLISNTFAELGAAFNSGDFSNVGSGLVNALSGLLQQLGQITIQEGLFNIAKAAAYLLSPTTAPLSPGLFGVGAGLIAAGGIASAAGGSIGAGRSSGISGQQGYKIPGFATGVTNFGGGMALVGERGPELVTLGRGSNVITNENISKFGRVNSQSQVFIPDTVLRGQDIVISYNRAEAFNKRR